MGASCCVSENLIVDVCGQTPSFVPTSPQEGDTVVAFRDPVVAQVSALAVADENPQHDLALAIETPAVAEVSPLNLPVEAADLQNNLEARVSPSSDESTAHEDKEEEKNRLLELCNSFAAKAIEGCPCTYLKESTGEQFRTKYRLDKFLEYLIVISNEDATKAEVACPLAAIIEVYSYVDDGETCFPADLTSKLTDKQKETLLMVVYRSGNSKVFRFSLLEEDAKSRDILLECLRVLIIYARSTAERQRSTP